MEKVGENQMLCDGKVYKVAKARGGKTCDLCAYLACRDEGKRYATTCYKLIGSDHYLRKK